MVAAVIAVPLFKRVGLGSVLGYLTAGLVIGPWGLRLVTDVDAILHAAEFGVVLLLFVIGLELQPSRLKLMRRSVFGLGGSQVAVTGLLLSAVAIAAGVPTAAAVVAGLGLALSSTAFGLQILAEKNQLLALHGRSAFGVLLFQDIAVIPLLAVVPLLAPASAAGGSESFLWPVAKALLVIALVIIGGRYLLRPIFRYAASVNSPEISTAAALAVVVGTALLMYAVGLSMALGAFLAGVLLADSEYRHELEANIAPFKDLLLGLFFIAVGMSVDLGLILSRPILVLGLTFGLLALKGGVLFGVGRAFGLDVVSARSLAVTIGQGGEFAFVIFSVAVAEQVMAKPLADLLILVVTLSMALTPLLFAADERLRARGSAPAFSDFDSMESEGNPVIIAGFGRFGQIVGRVLRVKNINFTALDKSPEQVDFVRKFGNKVFYGDASRLDLLRAAGAAEAKVFVLAIDDIDASVATAATIKRNFPQLKIIARARNRQHALQLMELGIAPVIRETYLSSLLMTREVLQAMGSDLESAKKAVRRFQDHDKKLLKYQQEIFTDEASLIKASKDAAAELQALFEQDSREEKREEKREGDRSKARR
ncbi:MAG: glutathione-regulated potassium-efflux system protein KefB [Gammaproteobacteria bacterium]|nr:glutathione-regulated potassium-efflux system protein KefB [Gammaproteobacteria bacterium]